ncbi:putative Ig domain-containing protein [Vibrio splendidus]
MKKVSLLAASVAIALSGCGGSDGGSSDEATPGGIVITAIDGYLENAQVWIDTNGNLKLDSEDKQLDSNTNENGEITLPNEYKDKAVFIKAIAGQTIDKTRGLVSSDFELATTAGATVVSPMTNMVVEQMEANSSLTLEQSRENVVKSITDSGLEASDTLIFGDYIADESQEAEALNVIGETLVDNSTISVEQQLQLTNSIAEETKKIIDDPTENLEDFSPVVEVPEDGGAPIVTPNSRPAHDQENGSLNPVVIIKGDAWAPIDTSLNFSDAESDTLTYELKELTGTLNGLNIDSTTGVIGGKLEAAGEFNYQIFAKDAHQSLSYPLNLKVTVEADNTAPVLNKAEQARLQLEEIDTWYLQEGEAFSQDIDISNLFTDADGHIRRTSVGLGGVVPGLSSDTDLENLIITISGTPARPWNQAGKITISVTDNDGAESEESLLLMPHVLEGTPVEPPTSFENTYLYESPIEGFDTEDHYYGAGAVCEVRYFDSVTKELYGSKRTLENYEKCPTIDASIKPSDNVNFESYGAYSIDSEGNYILNVEEGTDLITIKYKPEQRGDYFIIHGSETLTGVDIIPEVYNLMYAAYTNAEDINSTIGQWTTDGIENDNWVERQVHYIDSNGSVQQMKVDAAMNSVDENCVGNMCESGQADADIFINMSCDDVKDIYSFIANYSISETPIMWDVAFYEQGSECSVDFTSYSPISNGIHTLLGEVNEKYQGHYEDISFSFLKD